MSNLGVVSGVYSRLDHLGDLLYEDEGCILYKLGCEGWC